LDSVKLQGKEIAGRISYPACNLVILADTWGGGLPIPIGKQKMTKAVIIGAGQTGRGYIGRLLTEKNYDIIFVDQNQDIVKLLSEDNHFSVHFYDKDRTPVIVSGYQALPVSSTKLADAIHEADFIFTAVGEQNLLSVAKMLKAGLADKKKKTNIITCENGINPARVLKNHLEELEFPLGESVSVSQTAVFCSTVNLLETRLDILSQNENYFPYDADGLPGTLGINGAVPVHDFEKFLKRKIYTYNCLAGIISYFGYLKGYLVYGEAANDGEISDLMDELLTQLNPALAKYFNISLEEQQTFSQKALQKFKNKKILDYVIKNGRAAKRKLGSTERIMAPLEIIEKNQGNANILYFNAAAALCYWEELAGKSEPVVAGDSITELCNILQTSQANPRIKKVQAYLKLIKQNRGQLNLKTIIHSS
jgi:Mannitol-1-phosphate/altronate dehydrogenases